MESSIKFLKKNNLEFITSGNINIIKKRKVSIKPDIIEGYKRGATSSYFYKSYLKIIKYNIYSWMKPHNRVNDLDFYERLKKIGVRTGYQKKLTVIIKPRPGEEEIGIDQYLLSKKKYMKKYLKK